MLGWGVYVGGVQWLVWVIQIVSLVGLNVVSCVVGFTEWNYLTCYSRDGPLGVD